MIGREAPALGRKMVEASTSSASLGIHSLSLALAIAFSFVAAFPLASACFANTIAAFSTTLFPQSCIYLLDHHGLHSCGVEALHGGDVGRVVDLEARNCSLTLLVSERVAALFGR